MQRITLDAQTRIAKAEQGKVVVQAKNAELKNEVDRYKSEVDASKGAADAAGKDDATQLAWAKLQLERDRLELEREKLRQAEALEITRLEIENDREASAQHADNKAGKIETETDEGSE